MKWPGNEGLLLRRLLRLLLLLLRQRGPCFTHNVFLVFCVFFVFCLFLLCSLKAGSGKRQLKEMVFLQGLREISENEVNREFQSQRQHVGSSLLKGP
jgi:hypothetical protein